MNYIIDGFNLGFKNPSIAKTLKKGETDQAIRQILTLVNGHLTNTAGKIIVVFDGRRGISAAYSTFPGIQVVFSKKPQTADDIIRNSLRKSSEAAKWMVISSDNEILFTARDQGAKSMRAEVFLKKQSGKSDRNMSVENNQKYNPGNVDIEFWLKQFGNEKNK